MRKKILFSLTSTLTVLSACIFPNNTTILEPKKEESSEDRLKSEFLHQFKDNKDKYIENINISINTELQDNNIKVLSDKDSKSTIRNKLFLLGEHQTNESHIKNKNSNILEFKNLKNNKSFIKVA